MLFRPRYSRRYRHITRERKGGEGYAEDPGYHVGCTHIGLANRRRDHLKQVPEQLETLIGDKKFLQAALILVRSLRTINKREVAEIGAVSELRTYFMSQETVSLCPSLKSLTRT